MTHHRTAIIQHGDYSDALEVLYMGKPEPYYAMRYCVRVLENLVAGHPHMIISLDAKAGIVEHGARMLVGMPQLRLPSVVPARFNATLRGRQIRQLLDRFAPTRVLFRSGDAALATRVLPWCVERRVDTLVLMANFMLSDVSRFEKKTHRNLIAILNHPIVYLVGNHRWPATASLIEHGLAGSCTASCSPSASLFHHGGCWGRGRKVTRTRARPPGRTRAGVTSVSIWMS